MNLGMKIGSQSSNSDRGSNVTQSIPQFSGVIDDITLVQGVAAFISVAPFFSGGGLSFALAANSQPLPAGMSLSPQGVLQGVTSDLIEDQDIIFEVTNEEGAVQGGCLLSTIPREISVGLTGAVENQTHGLSAQSGVGLQAGIDQSNWTPASVSYQWHTVEAGPISGATSASFTPSDANLDASALFCEITAAPHGAVSTEVLIVRQTPPTVLAVLDDDILDQFSGDYIIDLDAVFGGALTQFSVTGSLATIDAQARELVISTDTATPGELLVVTAMNSGGSVSESLIITVEADGILYDQTAQFGAQTLAGFGAFQIVDATGQPVSSVSDLGTGSATGYTLSPSGQIAPSANAALSAQDGQTIDIDSDQGAARITLAVEPSAFSIEPDEFSGGQLQQVMDLGAAAVSGMTIYGRPGRQFWRNKTLNNNAFASTVTIASHDNDNRFTFASNTNNEIREPTNLTFYRVDFDWSFELGVSNSSAGMIILRNDVDNLNFVECELNGGLSETIALNGQPFTGSEWGYRGGVAKDGTTVLVGDLTIRDCKIHDLYRGFNLPGGQGVLTLEGNEIYNCSVDTGVLSGEFPNGRFVRWNILRNPIVIDPPEVAVTNIDTSQNRMTASSERFGDVGDRVVINMGASTATMPGGVNLPGVEGSNDYSCTVIDVSAGQTTLEFPVEITSVGAGVYIRTEPPHADFLQSIPQAGTTAVGFEVIGNIILGASSIDGYWPQGFFFEDIASSTVPGYYYDTLFAANVVWSGNSYGLGLFNSRRGIIVANTMVGPANTEPNALPRVSLFTQFGHHGGQNVMLDNLSARAFSSVASDTVLQNHDVTPSDYANAPFLTAPSGQAPQTAQELVARFARSDLDGSIDYANRTYDLAVLNSVSPFSFADVTNADLFVPQTSAPVQINTILDGQGSLSAVGAMVSLAGGISAEFKITDDAAGQIVVSDWSHTPHIIQSGQYLTVRTNAEADGLTSLQTVVVVGRNKTIWTVTTKAASPTVQVFEQKTNEMSIRTPLPDAPRFAIAASVKLTPPTALNRLFESTGKTGWTYNPAKQEAAIEIKDTSNQTIYKATYRLDLSKRRHVFFSYDAPNAVAKLVLDGIELPPYQIETQAGTGSGIVALSGLEICNRPGGNRSAGADQITQIVASTNLFLPTDVYTLGPKEDLSALDGLAQVVIDGSRMSLAQFNQGTNFGTGGAVVIVNSATDGGLTSGV